MAGKFADTITLGVKGVPQQLSKLMAVADPTTELHVAEMNIIGDDTNTGIVYIGGPRMVANANPLLPPANYFWALAGASNNYNVGSGQEINSTHCTDYWILSVADNMLIHVDTRVV